MLSRQGSAKLFDTYEHGLQTRQLSAAKLTSALISRNSDLQNYNRLQSKLAQLTEQHSLLQSQTNHSREAMLKQRRITEQAALELRSLIDQQTSKLKSLTIALNDALGEAESLAELKRERDEQIQRLNEETQELRNIGEKINQDRGELQGERNAVEGEIREVDSKVGRLAANNAGFENKLDTLHTILVELELSCQKKGEHLRQYEVENNKIDRDLAEMIAKEDALEAKAEELEEYIKELRFQESESQTDLGRLQSCLADTRQYLASQRDKHTELCGKLKQRERLLAKLQKQIQQQALQSDFLISRNGQICDVNSTLKKDLSLSQRHLQSLVRNNQQLSNEIQNFRKQDRGILAQIQNRTTPRLAKLDESKVTEVSYRVRGSRLAESPLI